MTAAIYVPIISPDADSAAAVARRREEILADIYPVRTKTPKGARPGTRQAWAEINAVWVEDIDWLLSNGESVGAIIQRTHMTAEAIAKRLRRNGRADLAGHFWRFTR